MVKINKSILAVYVNQGLHYLGFYFMFKRLSQRICVLVLAGAGLVLSVMLLQVLIVRACVNISYIGLLKALNRTQSEGMRVGFGYNGSLEDFDVEPSVSLFEKALSVEPHDFGARRGLGRALLSQNKADAAAQILHPLVLEYAGHPLFFLDLLKAYSLAGWTKEILALKFSNGWRNVPEFILSRVDWGAEVKQVVQAYIAWDNLQAESSIVKQPVELVGSSTSLRHKVSSIKWLAAKGDSLGLLNGLHGLRNFGLYDALFVRSGFLSKSDLLVIPQLIQSELWPLSLARSVVSWLVWRYYGVDELEDLLAALVEKNPQSSVWPFYYGDYHYRRGDWKQAAVLYQHAFDLGNDQPEVLLRLGLVHEALAAGANDQQGILMRARDWYEKYLQRNGGDLLAGKLLIGVYQALGDARYNRLERIFASKTDITASVARLLEIDSSKIRLGPNLCPSGDFDQWQSLPSGLLNKPKDWNVSNMSYKGSPFNTGAFVCGSDATYAWQGFSARIAGIWLGQKDNLLAGRFGFWFGDKPLQVEPLSPYVVSFYYRTQSQIEEPAIWLSSDNHVLLHAITGSDDYRLPATSGQWWKFVVVAWNLRSDVVSIHPLLRTHTTGEVWFDNFQISKITVEDMVLADHSVRVGIEKLEMGQ